MDGSGAERRSENRIEQQAGEKSSAFLNFSLKKQKTYRNMLAFHQKSGILK
jgi:hypothetical protein